MFKNSGKKLLAILLMACMVFAFAGCAKEKSSADESVSKLDEIKKSGKIVVGTCADYPPYEFHKEINGKDTIVGFDIEIAKAIAEEIGVELEIKDMKFDGLLPALVANKIDFIAAGMNPTEERAKSVDFSKVYYSEEQRILVKKEIADKIKTKDDFKGLKVGAQKATIQEELALGLKGAEVKSLSKITDLVLELTNNKVDGVVLVKPVAEAYAKQNKDLAVLDLDLNTENEEDSSVAIAINKGNKDLVEVINKTLDKLISEGKVDQFITEATKLADEE
ncbi:transporter substrate-binding domain-containing protein [Crassaminicella thermophila]|uniref:Transporter substrate-binding domain-containing protein n=1 Tax=Crassaminicella thermophila TaxID=2599308 RepID=A0A5C0SFJ7_CRATE|nr:transporter substrate-binding domain-containing protein [Crassaminicella thermophila]QEK12662.1 transporter substrate-binding domain-containing protein [Crassaminicella thermophila]